MTALTTFSYVKLHSVEQLGFYGLSPHHSSTLSCSSFPLSVDVVLVTVVKELGLTAAERCRPQISGACLGGEMDAAYRKWMYALAGIVATRPVEDVEKAVVIFEQYNEPLLASRLKGE